VNLKQGSERAIKFCMGINIWKVFGKTENKNVVTMESILMFDDN
jgi:hypothetical protein